MLCTNTESSSLTAVKRCVRWMTSTLKGDTCGSRCKETCKFFSSSSKHLYTQSFTQTAICHMTSQAGSGVLGSVNKVLLTSLLLFSLFKSLHTAATERQSWSFFMGQNPWLCLCTQSRFYIIWIILPALANNELFMFCTKVILIQINSSETSVIQPKTRCGCSDSANNWR